MEKSPIQYINEGVRLQAAERQREAAEKQADQQNEAEKQDKQEQAAELSDRERIELLTASILELEKLVKGKGE
jgi:acetyl-CoA carboxylase carboxyltransferase component